MLILFYFILTLGLKGSVLHIMNALTCSVDLYTMTSVKYNNITIIIVVWIGSGGGSGLWFPELLNRKNKNKDTDSDCF